MGPCPASLLASSWDDHASLLTSLIFFPQYGSETKAYVWVRGRCGKLLPGHVSLPHLSVVCQNLHVVGSLRDVLRAQDVMMPLCSSKTCTN
jgi:hypothetical protein